MLSRKADIHWRGGKYVAIRTIASAVVGALTLASCAYLSSEPPLGESVGGADVCLERVPRDGLLAFGAGGATNGADFPVEVTKVELVDPIGMELVGAKVQYVSVEGEPVDVVGVLAGWPPDFMGDEKHEARFRASPELEDSVIPPSTETEPAFTIGVRAEPNARSGPLRLTYRSGDDEWTWTGSVTFRVGDGTSC